MQKIFVKNQKTLTDSILKNKDDDIYHRDESMIASNLMLSPIKISKQPKSNNKG